MVTTLSVFSLSGVIAMDNENSTVNQSDDHTSDDHDQSTYSAAIFFLFVAFAVGAAVRHLLKNTSLPYTVVLIVLGMLIASVTSWPPLAFIDLYLQIAHLDPHLMLIIFLPTLIFESAFALDVHTFKKMIGQAIVLAGPGLLVSSFLLSILTRYIFPYHWSWTVSMLFGTILSATDPVAIVALLKEIGASKQLGTIIEGESLLNDGAAIVLYNVLIDELIPGRGRDAIQVFLYFLRVAVGGPVFGYLMAKISIFWLSRVYNDALVEISITLVSTYVTYYVGENLLQVSGVLAVVALGYEINSRKTNISPEVEVFLHRFWEVLGYLANTLIFIIVGIVIRQNAFKGVNATDWILLTGLYFGIIIIRMVVTVAFFPLINRIGYSMNIREIIVIAWGGLKGAVSLALALSVAETPAINFNAVGSKVLFHTAGIVMLTLVINATTTKCLLNLLGMRRISLARSKTVSTAVEEIHDTKMRAISLLKADRFLADADWSIVSKCAEIPNPYKKPGLAFIGGSYLLPCKIANQTAIETDDDTQNEHAEIMEEIRRLIVKRQKTSYWHQFELGLLSREAARVLINLADTVLDIPERLISIDDISPHWSIPTIYPKINQLVDWVVKNNAQIVPVPRNAFLKLLYIIAKSSYLEWLVIVAIIMNVTLSVTEITVMQQFNAMDVVFLIFKILNGIFYSVYLLESIIKIIGLRQYYWTSKWSYLELLILLMITSEVIASELNSSNTTVRIILRASALIFLLRFIQAKKTVLPLILKMISYFANRHLRVGYDIGRGFVVGEEDVLSQFESFKHIDDSIASKFKKTIEETRLCVIRSLGLIRKEYPGIALSIKTHHATRAVLNNCQETVKTQLSNGLLDETDAAKLMMLIEKREKSLENTQASLPTPCPETLFSQISWLNGLSHEVIISLRKCATIEQFDTDDILIEKNEPLTGVFILISGLVKSVATALTDQGPEEIIIDFFGPGDILGELGMILNITKHSEIGFVCETDIQTFFIECDDLLMIMDQFPILQERLWKIYGTRIAPSLLENMPLYQSFTVNMLSNMCENSYIAQPAPSKPLPQIIDITDDMREVIVIHDEVHCNITLRAFKAPSVIPKRIHHVTMETYEPRLLVILNEDHQLIANSGAGDEEDDTGSNIVYRILNRLFGNRRNVIFTAEEGGLIRNPGASDVMINQHTTKHTPTEEPMNKTDTSHQQDSMHLNENRQTKTVTETTESKDLRIVIPEIRTTDSELTRSRSALVLSRGDLASVSRLSMPARLISREDFENSNLNKPATAMQSSNDNACRSFDTAPIRLTSAIGNEGIHEIRDSAISGNAGTMKRGTARGQIRDNTRDDFKEQATHKSSLDGMRLQVPAMKREKSKRGRLAARHTIQDGQQLTLNIPSVSIPSKNSNIRASNQRKRKGSDAKNEEDSTDSDQVWHHTETDEEKKIQEEKTIEHLNHFSKQKELKPIEIQSLPMPAVMKDDDEGARPFTEECKRADKIQTKVPAPLNKGGGDHQKIRKTEGTEQATRKKKVNKERETGASETIMEGAPAKGGGEPTSVSTLQSTYSHHPGNRKRTSVKARKIHKPKSK